MTSPESRTVSKKRKTKMPKKSKSAKSTQDKSKPCDTKPCYHVIFSNSLTGQLSRYPFATGEKAAEFLKTLVGRPFRAYVVHGTLVPVTKGPNRHLLTKAGSLPLFDPPSMEVDNEVDFSDVTEPDSAACKQPVDAGDDDDD